MVSPSLTIFPRVPGHHFWFRAPAVTVPALDLDLVGDKRGCVLHGEGVPLDQVLPPLTLHPQPPVTQLVLQAWTVVFHWQQGLRQGNTYKVESIRKSHFTQVNAIQSAL